jgi:hypothetical protein
MRCPAVVGTPACREEIVPANPIDPATGAPIDLGDPSGLSDPHTPGGR